MAKVMLTVELDPGEVDVEHVREKLGLEPGEFDEEFGVVPVDPGKHLYAVLVEEAAANRAVDADQVHGPYSNPRIVPFDLS
jgi:hypothetical protein